MSNPPNEPPDPGPNDAGGEAAAGNASSDADPDAAGGTAATSTGAGTAERSDDATGPRPREIGGQAGPEPTRYGDWEKKGRCTDF